jgi:hypothetical protein
MLSPSTDRIHGRKLYVAQAFDAYLAKQEDRLYTPDTTEVNSVLFRSPQSSPYINFFIINNNFWSVIFKENSLVFSMHAASVLRFIFQAFNLTPERAAIFKDTK